MPAMTLLTNHQLQNGIYSIYLNYQSTHCTVHAYTGWAKKLHTAFFAIAYSQPIFIIFGLHKPQEICPPTTIYVTTLPCEILIATVLMFTYIKQSTYYFGGNNCQFLSKFHEYNF